tara:strand:- start:119 stop:376 length:258 start_codon:yes stop_codon:yes gene_type:complete
MAVSIKDSKKVYNMLVEIFLETFGKRINYNAATIKSIPQWDSIKGIQLLLAIEDKFKLKFSSKELEQFDSFDKIYKILLKKCLKS